MSREETKKNVEAVREATYLEGSRRAHLIYLEAALRGLGRDHPKWDEKRWLLEREEAIIALRRICADHGDNDWPDDLHLADIIDKHLAPHL